MGFDIIPGISQIKSVVQLAFGDKEGAKQTQENFLKECPIVSQVTSVVQLVSGDSEGAAETQKRCGKTLLKMADGIPVVGHAKGAIHYAFGDKEGGNNAMKSATRSTGVMAGGVAGFCVGGPAGAVAGGIYGGAVLDTTTTIITNTPSGYIAAIDNIVKNPNPGDIFDTILMPVGDGLTGYVAGQTYNNMTTKTGSSNSASSNTKGSTSNSNSASNGGGSGSGGSASGSGSASASGSGGSGSGSASASGVIENNVATGQAMQAAAEAELAGRLNFGLECPPGMSEAQYLSEINKNAAMMKEAQSLQGISSPSIAPLKPPKVNLGSSGGSSASASSGTSAGASSGASASASASSGSSASASSGNSASASSGSSASASSGTSASSSSVGGSFSNKISTDTGCIQVPINPSTVSSLENATVKFIELDYHVQGKKIKILSSDDRFTNLLISLLEMEINECIKLLKNMGIEWPFDKMLNTLQVAKILFETGTVGKDYKEKDVEELLKMRGKKAAKAVTKYMTALVDTEKDVDKNRHMRGEHVINNGVLKLHKDIIDTFLSRQLRLDFNEMIARIRFPFQINTDYNEPVSNEIRKNIETRMVVHFPDDFKYFNANSLVYGIAVQYLKSRCVSHMMQMFNNWPMRGNGTEHSASIRIMAKSMNELEIYVDKQARDAWLIKNPNNPAIYRQTRSVVVDLFENIYEKLHQWVETLKVNGF